MNFSWAISNPKRWCCESAVLYMAGNLKNSAVNTTGKGQFSFQSQRKAMPNNAQTTGTIALISHASLTLCNPMDCSLPGSSVHRIFQAIVLEWIAISFSNAWKWKVKVKLLSRARLFTTSWTADHQAPSSIGFSRQEYWSGAPLLSPTSVWDECNCAVVWTLFGIAFLWDWN